MITDKYGSQVKLLAYYGQHQGASLCKAEVTFMPGTEHQSARIKYIWAESLVGNWDEICDAGDKLPEEVLDPGKLRFAIEEASCTK